MPDRIPLLFNPRSGRGQKDPDALLSRLALPFRERLEALPLGPPWDFEEAIGRARAAGGPLLVWGGDGTIHHAARALLKAGCPVPLGAVPGGSGNGLARGLRTPLEPHGAVQRLLEGREFRMDVGLLDGEPFFNLCGTGFEAQVARAFESGEGRGFLGYARDCLNLWRTTTDFLVTWSPEFPSEAEPLPPRRAPSLQRFPSSAWSLCLANLPQYGSGLWIAPGANPTDGLLQWAVLDRPGAFDLLSELPPLFKEGGHSLLRREGPFPGGRLETEAALPWHLDGEPVASRDRADLAVEPRAFRMQVTGACPWS
ncbi:MAG: hypothetical protein HY823_08915 [Acidobacteria bacterium]|nr:hypothetical protein [Acidobacteriota bacterium]